MSFLFGSPKKDQEKLDLADDLEKTNRQLKVANDTIYELSEQLEVLQKSREATIKEAVEKAIAETKAQEKEIYEDKLLKLTQKHQDELTSKDKECSQVIEAVNVMHKREIAFIETTKESIIIELNRDLEEALNKPSTGGGILSNLLGLGGSHHRPAKSNKRRLSTTDENSSHHGLGEPLAKRSASLSS